MDPRYDLKAQGQAVVLAASCAPLLLAAHCSHPEAKDHSIVSILSVNTVPNTKPLGSGFSLKVVAGVIIKSEALKDSVTCFVASPAHPPATHSV